MAQNPVSKTRMPGPSDPDTLLKHLIRDLTLFTSEEGFRLTSGRTSHFLFNLKNLYGHPEAANLITDKLLATLRRLDFDYIAGIELGAVFPVTAAILKSASTDRPIEGFIVRKRAKEHGTKNRIEGLRTLPSRGTVVVLDDVTTTGGSLLEAVQAVRELGCTVRQAVTLLDREEGATEALRGQGVELVALFTKRDFLDASVT